MIPVSKVMCILACGFILGVAQEYASAQAGNYTHGDTQARIGGQAGEPYPHAKHEHASIQAKEQANGEAKARIGGQAGQPYDQMKPASSSTPAESHPKSARIGGQAGS